MSNPSPAPKADNHPAARASITNEEHVTEATRAVEQARDQDGAAAAERLSIDDFEQLYAEQRGRVFSTAFRMVGNQTDAEDLTQDVFVKVYKKIDKFRGASSLSTWIYRITMNTCLDFLRKRKRRPTVPLEFVGDITGKSSNLKELIESYVTRLPDGYRKVFILHDIQGLKHSEVADVLGISEGASKSQLHRARARMRRYLTPFVRDWGVQ